MTFDDVVDFTYKQWQQPEKKYAFLAAVLTAVVVPLGTSLTILPILGAITVAAIGAYVATNIIQYAVSFSQKLKQTLDHVDDTITKLNQEIVPRVDKVLDGVQKTIDKSDKAVDDLHTLVGKIDTTVQIVNTTTMPEIDKAIAQVQTTTLPEMNKAIAQVQTGTIPELTKAITNFQANTLPDVNKTIEDLRTTVQGINSGMATTSTLMAPVTKFAGLFRNTPATPVVQTQPEQAPVANPTPVVETAPVVEVEPTAKGRGRARKAKQQTASETPAEDVAQKTPEAITPLRNAKRRGSAEVVATEKETPAPSPVSKGMFSAWW